MNIQHSSRTDEWYTPISIINRVHLLLGRIDFDPASDSFGNSRIQANRFLTKEDNGLLTSWTGKTMFINPPGGKIKNQSKSGLFWQKLMEYRASGRLDHAVFLAFSLEQLQVTANQVMGIADFPFCVPKKRIAFDTSEGFSGKAPSHSNMVVYIPGFLDYSQRFESIFNDLGKVVNTRKHP